MQWSLRTKAILLFFALVLLAVGITSAMGAWNINRLLNVANVEDVEAEAEKFTYVSQLAMAVKDRQELERLVDSFAREEVICFLAVYDVNDDKKPLVLNAGDPALWKKYEAGEGEGSLYLAVTRPIVLASASDDSLTLFSQDSPDDATAKTATGEQVIGYVVIGRSTREMYAALDQQMLVTSCSMLGAMFIGGLAIYLSITAWSDRLNKLVAASASMSRGDFDCEIPPASGDEIGRLAGAFNQMRLAVRQRDVELRRFNETLQQRVEQRTAALAEAKNAAEQAAMSLELQQRLLRDVIDNIPHYVMWKDRRGVFRGCNQVLAKTLGYDSPDQIVGTTDRDHSRLPRCFVEHILAQERQVVETGQPILMVEESVPFSQTETMQLLSSRVPLRDAEGHVVGVLTTCTDITDRKHIEAEREQLNARLVDASRQAGMAEVATGVLHNVGNVLNSINISTTVLGDALRQSKTTSLAKVVQLLEEHQGDLDAYLNGDPKGQQLVPYLHKLRELVDQEKILMLNEIRQLTENVEHIKHIITMQQSLARNGSTIEQTAPSQILEEAIQINSPALQRHEVAIDRQITPDLPLIETDRHKVIQILVNLINNAKHAMRHLATSDKHLVLRIQRADEGVSFQVIDNGTGITNENLARIFSHGFTTRPDGHGFGLHYGALAARELGGELTVHSNGPDRGATFTLTLPLQAAPQQVGGLTGKG